MGLVMLVHSCNQWDDRDLLTHGLYRIVALGFRRFAHPTSRNAAIEGSRLMRISPPTECSVPSRVDIVISTTLITHVLHRGIRTNVPSGLILDPEVPIRAIFNYHDPIITLRQSHQ